MTHYYAIIVYMLPVCINDLYFKISNYKKIMHFEKRQQTLRSESTKLLHPGPWSKKSRAIHRSWLLHRTCGINCLFIYVKGNQSLSFVKKSSFHIRPTTLIWASTGRHMTNSFSDYGPPH